MDQEINQLQLTHQVTQVKQELMVVTQFLILAVQKEQQKLHQQEVEQE